MKVLRTSGLLLLLLALAGCGFQLRGSENVPAQLQPVRVASIELDHRFAKFLKRRWQSTGIELATGVEAGASRVEILRVERSRELLSTDSAGNPLEYELIRKVRFRFLVAGDERIAPETLEARRAYRFNVGQLLVSEADAARLDEDMQQSLADALLQRIAYAD